MNMIGSEVKCCVISDHSRGQYGKLGTAGIGQWRDYDHVAGNEILTDCTIQLDGMSNL